MDDIRILLENLKSENRFREIPTSDLKDRVDLLSNDYLGLAQRSGEWEEEFRERFGDAPHSASASRLLSRNQHYERMLEDFLESLYGRPALLFNSGYHANTGIISALAKIPGTLFLSDKLIHASTIDGLRLGDADFKRFAHNDIEKLTILLDRHSNEYQRIIVLTESIFSMDGDLAPLKEMVELKKNHPNMMIILDEAHGFGVRGERGLGLAEEYGLIPQIDIIVGTFGKAAGSAGAFAVCDQLIKELFINTARSFIFSTALPPICHAWSILMIEKIITMGKERFHLQELSSNFVKRIEEITQRRNPSQSQIVPILTGDAAKALSLASSLREGGYDSLPIRRPTVPPGGERLRLSLNASLNEELLNKLLRILKECY